MFIKKWRILSILLLTAALLAGCTKQQEEEEIGSIVEWASEPEESSSIESEVESLTEESVPEVETIEETEQVPGKDYQMEISVLALQIGADESSISVVWEHTYTDGEYIRIWPATEPDNYLDYPGTLSTSIDNSVKHYTVTIPNLLPATQYGYQIMHNEERAKAHYFITNESKTDFEFLAAGDPQIGTNDSYQDSEMWKQSIKMMLEQTGETNFIFSLGDAVDDKNSKYQFDLFMQPEELKSIPVAAIVGNHDDNSPYYGQYFTMPNLDSAGRGKTQKIGQASANFSFVYGETLFLGLNSNNTNYAEHTAFMADTINSYVQNKGERPRWIIAAMHHSIFSITDHLDSSNYEERQKAMAPIFSQLGVDVVLMGHDHSYARTYLMNGAIPDIVKNPDGSRPKEVQAKEGQTLYFTLNSSTGSKYYDQAEISGEIAMNNQENVPNMTKISVRRDKIIFTTCRVEDDSTVMEEFVLLHK